MTSPIERQRQAILQQLNNQGRRLERICPVLASELKLRKVVERLAVVGRKPRGPKGK